MRTTVNLPDDLMAKLKRSAAERGTTVTALMEEALRHSLAVRRPAQRAAKARFTVYGKGGVLPGVDLDDSAALMDLIDTADEAPGR